MREKHLLLLSILHSSLVLLFPIYSSPHLSALELLPSFGPSMYSSLSCSWSFSWLSLSSISCLMAFNKSSTAALLPRGSELSTCSWWTYLTSGEKVSTGLTLLCLCWSSGSSPSGCGCYISAGSSSSITASTCLPMFLFLGPLVIPVNVRGDVLG